MSPTGRYIGLVEIDSGIVEHGSYRIPPRGTLVILDTVGKVLERIPRDVQRYAWWGGTRLAYISGVYEETEREFDATGAWTVDVESGSATSLPGRPRALAYASFDSSLYLAYAARPRGYRIVKYDPSSHDTVGTAHKGLSFSEDGRFYLSFSESGDHPQVYETQTDVVVILPDVERIGVADRWLPSGGSHLLVRKVPSTTARVPTQETAASMHWVRPRGARDVDYVIYDVDSRHVVQTLHAQFPAWAAPHGDIPFVSGGRANVVSRPK